MCYRRSAYADIWRTSRQSFDVCRFCVMFAFASVLSPATVHRACNTEREKSKWGGRRSGLLEVDPLYHWQSLQITAQAIQSKFHRAKAHPFTAAENTRASERHVLGGCNGNPDGAAKIYPVRDRRQDRSAPPERGSHRRDARAPVRLASVVSCVSSPAIETCGMSIALCSDARSRTIIPQRNTFSAPGR